MNEMLYGNSGKSDEGINIGMEQNLYYKLQRSVVPKFKSILSLQHQKGDRNFIYLGEVSEKSGSYTIYGYNASLASDLRGGHYGHYIAVPMDAKAATVDFKDVAFFSEEGFMEYVNNKTLNEEKRFKIIPSATDINVEAKKKIVNNIMESFMKVRKRKCVAFSFEDCALEEFNARSLGVLLDIIKYIPLRMRKNIAFVSHVSAKRKLPDLINLAVYPSGDIMPYDCVNIDNPGEKFTDGVFFAYVEKVFAMSDNDREAYFEKLYNEIEIPALIGGVEVKSDMYLLDVSTRDFWKNGAPSEVVKSIFSSLDSVLRIYPDYARLAGERLAVDKQGRTAYIKNVVDIALDSMELKKVYDNVRGVFEVCSIEVEPDVIDIFKAKANSFVLSMTDYSSLVAVVGDIFDMDSKILDSDAVCSALKEHMEKNLTFENIFDIYHAFKEKQYIDIAKLNLCLTEATERCILNLTDSYAESKDKLTCIEHAFENFRYACGGRDFSVLKEVYDSFHAKFSGIMGGETVSKGNSIVYTIEEGMSGYCTFYEIKNYIKNLSEVEVEFDPVLKAKTSAMYRRLTQALYRRIADAELDYREVVKLISELLPVANRLNSNGVYDGEIRNGWGEGQYVVDGLLRFATVFDDFLRDVNDSGDLTELLLSHDTSRAKIKREETAIKSLFAYYSAVIMDHWMIKNRKHVSNGSLKKAIRNVKKGTGESPLGSGVDIVEDFIENGGKKKSRKKSSPRIIIVLILIIVLVVGGVFWGYKNFVVKPKNDLADAGYIISNQEVFIVREYLKEFSGNNLSDAQFVIGTLKIKGKKPKYTYVLDINNKLGSTIFDGKFEVLSASLEEVSKNYLTFADIVPEKKYAFVIQKTTDDSMEKIYVRDMFEIPQELSGYDFNTTVINKELDEEENKFCNAIIKYIGHLDKLVKTE